MQAVRKHGDVCGLPWRGFKPLIYPIYDMGYIFWGILSNFGDISVPLMAAGRERSIFGELAIALTKENLRKVLSQYVFPLLPSQGTAILMIVYQAGSQTDF